MKFKQVLLNLRSLMVSGTTPIGSVREKLIFSFVVDADPYFAYQGLHLARSLIEHCEIEANAVHVQFTPDVPLASRQIFSELGCTTHGVMRFGDGRYCNKIGQLDNLLSYDFERVVLLDTDMIAIANLRPYLGGSALQAKVVDFPNPSISALEEIAWLAGLETLPPRVKTEVGEGETFRGNCNGGFYAIPKALCPAVAKAWRHWALWLMENIGPLAREEKQAHVDQVAMWLAIHTAKIPFQPAPSNVNYFVHFRAENRLLTQGSDIALLHYHGTLNVLGLLEPEIQLNPAEQAVVAKANRQMSVGFDSVAFWNLRYSRFSDRGSGVGSRGENLVYKRDLLRQQGAEQAASVLDFGCGDLEVVKALDLKEYLGIDSSDTALELARAARPDWAFQRFMIGDNEEVIPSRDFVICFEVLIHQPSNDAYNRLVRLIADRTVRTLIVSGYDHSEKASAQNHMIFFYEPVEISLKRTGRFRSIQKIGSHTSVTIYRCDI